MLTSQTVYDKIEITSRGAIQLRMAEIIYRDTVEIARESHRTTLLPGDDVTMYSKVIQDIAKVLWTEQVIAEYNASKRIKET